MAEIWPPSILLMFSNIFGHAKFGLPISYTFRIVLMQSRMLWIEVEPLLILLASQKYKSESLSVTRVKFF